MTGLHRLGAALWIALAACAPPPGASQRAAAPAASGAPVILPGVLVDADWLQRHQGAEGLVVLDARSKEAFAAGHVPGAVSVPHRATYDDRPGRTSELAPIQTISALLGAAGVDRGRSVVIAGGGDDYRPAAWLFWVLEVHGHPSVAVLDGGLPAWRAAGGQVSLEPSRPEPRTFVASFDASRLAHKLQVARAIEDASTVLLDARSPAEYRGEVDNGFPRAGHVPTAINLPAAQAQAGADGGCSMLEPHALRAVYAPVAGRKVLAYCNTGQRAAVTYVALRSLSADVAVYDGSWAEWSADERLPVAVGDAP